MPRLIWSPSALKDVQRAWRFLADKNMDAARRAVKAIREGVMPIGQHPEIGRPVDEMATEFREWPILLVIADTLPCTVMMARTR